MYYKNGENAQALEELRLAVQGGQTNEGVVVQGLALDPGDFRIVEFYYTYGLALANAGQCDLAREIFTTLLRVLQDDEIVVANAEEGLSICQVLEGTIVPEETPTLTPTP
jgi:Flp pilus assembly protein TadD